MKLAFFDYTLDTSVRIYIDNITRNLGRSGVELLPFDARKTPPADAHLYWDPRLTGGTPPWWKMRPKAQPVVATLHDGVPQLSIPPWEYYRDFGSALRGLYGTAKRLIAWRRHWLGRCAALITPSEFGKVEAQRNMRLSGEKIVPIYHGVDHKLFRPADTSGDAAPYLLHVSAYQPKKNLKRVLAAYATLPVVDRPRLLAVAPGYHESSSVPGVDLVRRKMSQSELAPIYQNALAFLFPSLHESFGMPIVEAMACGCPVVTSKSGACAEIAADAALLVDPKSIGDLARAMKSLIDDIGLRNDLRARSLNRARSFTWQRSAKCHLQVFEEALLAAPS